MGNHYQRLTKEIKMERKLASVQKITEIVPHDNADTLEIAKVLGWNVIVKKGEFKAGDYCVYCEVDSVLPERTEFEFLRNKQFRIKTIRLRGVVSQGLCLPMNVLPAKLYEMQHSLVEGGDVTESLGIIKYEVPIPACLSGQVKGMRPSFVPKTDETRIQAAPDVLERYKGRIFYMTEKVDGSSGSYYYNDGDFGVCSRKLDILEDDKNSFWRASRRYCLKEKMYELKRNIVIQGELLGPGVEKNKYKLKEHDLLIFNIYDIDKSAYVNFCEMIKIVNDLGMYTVPLLGEVRLDHNIESIVELSKGNSRLYETKREGIVLRPLQEERDEELGRLSFKVINPDFLLKHDE